ncbi:MFS transporter [Pseudochryseolinea flava]|uniref:MFS transporter n=1 Tax=Pseudochryseolinea flava TaxID=2059302 RepID=A0A364Y0T1_9BACT|nr:MFS transporter [Pseudochryseolinea flava]RAW00191.1 MFS transporter [Pseudochryseolinea flava]
MKISVSKLLPVLISYFVMGFVDIVGVSTGYAKRDFGLSPVMTQVLPSMVFIWFFILSLPCSIMQSRFGKKRILTAGIMLTALGMFLPFIHYSYPLLLLSFVFIGVGNTIIQVSSNPLLRDVTDPDKFSSFISLSQFIKAISSLLGPILVTVAVTSWGDWKNILLVYGFVSVLTALWLALTSIEETKPREAATFMNSLRLLKNPLITTMVLAIFALVGIDVGLNTNIQYLLSSKFNMDLEAASLGISVYFFSLMASRFIGAIILSRIDNLKFFVATSLLTIVFLGLLVVASSPTIAFIFIGLTGLVSGNLFALIFSLTIQKLPDKSNEISGLMIMAVVGGAIVPPLIGYSQNFVSAATSLLILVLCAGYIYVSSMIYKRF